MVKLRSVGIVCLGLVLATSIWAQEPPGQETCPHEKDWKPTNEELQRVLSDHKAWLNESEFSSKGRANLCNVNLSGAKLNNANLRFAELNNADLSRAELNNADLAFAELNNANLGGAKLNNADLTSARLNNADLRFAELNKANLSGARLNSADLTLAELNNADLSFARLNNADLGGAKLNNADLSFARLNNADLRGAELNNADLISAELKDSKIANITLTKAAYAPASAPPDSYVAGITGLSSVTFPVAGSETGLVQLRDLLQKAGLRDLEREATFAIESGRTASALKSWRENLPGAAEGAFRYVAFELTTGYGLWPGRALLLIAALWVLLIPIYAWPVWRSKRAPTASGIYRIWPKDRVEVREGQPTLDNPARIERLHGVVPAAMCWAAYFSLLSTFQIGFREFSVGTWLTRAQPRNFALESTGWVRTVSGVQSLLCVYLLAMWLLTYFGRPFQ
jgi:uncharacterized protein YjbI with pentapeptide repeats